MSLSSLYFQGLSGEEGLGTPGRGDARDGCRTGSCFKLLTTPKSQPKSASPATPLQAPRLCWFLNARSPALCSVAFRWQPEMGHKLANATNQDWLAIPTPHPREPVNISQLKLDSPAVTTSHQFPKVPDAEIPVF